MADILPRFYRRQQQIDDARKVARIILETGCSYEEAGGKLVNGADGHNWQRMRGLPIVARGVRGTAPGTDPLGALLAKEAKQR